MLSFHDAWLSLCMVMSARATAARAANTETQTVEERGCRNVNRGLVELWYRYYLNIVYKDKDNIAHCLRFLDEDDCLYGRDRDSEVHLV